MVTPIPAGTFDVTLVGATTANGTLQLFSNGTFTYSPDFNFKDCCDWHDQCYCAGGKADDRLFCDQGLLLCIGILRGHPILAQIYYAAVRAFGSKHFNWDPC